MTEISRGSLYVLGAGCRGFPLQKDGVLMQKNLFTKYFTICAGMILASITVLGALLINAVFVVIFYPITAYLMHRRLNLE